MCYDLLMRAADQVCFMFSISQQYVVLLSSRWKSVLCLHYLCLYWQTFSSDRSQHHFEPFNLPEGETLARALDRVLRLPSVASKRYLTNKVWKFGLINTCGWQSCVMVLC